MPTHLVPLRLLFLCTGNAARSQMAEGLARHLLGDAVQVSSAGTRPAGRVSRRATAVMAEVGVDLSGQHSKGLDAVDLGAFDLVLSLCSGPECPELPPGLAHRSWALPDPDEEAGQAPYDEQLLRFRILRDSIHARLLALSRELGLRAAPVGSPRRPTAAVIGWKNSGKTTLVERLVTELVGRGFRVGTVKATHHDVEPDPPGKDSWRHRRAGARETVLVGPGRFVLTHEGPAEPLEAAERLGAVDLVLVEGLRGASLPKIEVVAPDSERPVLARTDRDIFLVAAAQPLADLPTPSLDRDAVAAIADALLARLGLPARV